MTCHGVESTRVGLFRLAVFKLLLTLVELRKSGLNQKLVDNGLLSSMQKVFLDSPNHTILHNLYVKLWKGFFNTLKGERALKSASQVSIDPVSRWFISGKEDQGCLQLFLLESTLSQARERRLQAPPESKGKPDPKWNFIPHIESLILTVYQWRVWAERQQQMKGLLEAIDAEEGTKLIEHLRIKFPVETGDRTFPLRKDSDNSDENDPFTELNQHEAFSGGLESTTVETVEIVVGTDKVTDLVVEDMEQATPVDRSSLGLPKRAEANQGDDDPWNEFNDFSPDEVQDKRGLAGKFSNNPLRPHPEDTAHEAVIIDEDGLETSNPKRTTNRYDNSENVDDSEVELVIQTPPKETVQVTPPADKGLVHLEEIEKAAVPEPESNPNSKVEESEPTPKQPSPQESTPVAVAEETSVEAKVLVTAVEVRVEDKEEAKPSAEAVKQQESTDKQTNESLDEKTGGSEGSTADISAQFSAVSQQSSLEIASEPVGVAATDKETVSGESGPSN